MHNAQFIIYNAQFFAMQSAKGDNIMLKYFF